MILRTALALVPLSVKQLTRHRVRTLLTVSGIAAGMLLYTLVGSMQAAAARATRS